MDEFIATCVPTQTLLQTPFDVAVVMPTVLRPSLSRAVASIFRQRFAGRIQVLIGIDKPIGNPSILDEIRRKCPAHCVVSVFDPGYSTSLRNGGLYPGGCGGALRTILSYAANSRAVAYLDDDNWFGEDHLRTLRAALVDHDYAFSMRWYVDRESGQPLCVDEWESVGPGAGVFQQRFGGFVDPNCLMLDKVKCEPALRWWCFPLPGDPQAMSEDRMVFEHLRKHCRGSAMGQATSYYVIHPEDGMHSRRLQWVREMRGAGASARGGGDEPMPRVKRRETFRPGPPASIRAPYPDPTRFAIPLGPQNGLKNLKTPRSYGGFIKRPEFTGTHGLIRQGADLFVARAESVGCGAAWALAM